MSLPGFRGGQTRPCRWRFLAHLQRGSLAVAKGGSVTTGQQIGQCGNSGNTSETHLHFHMQTSLMLGQGEGLPAQFRNYLANGVLIDRGEPTEGETIEPGKCPCCRAKRIERHRGGGASGDDVSGCAYQAVRARVRAVTT
ncbi:M23 family metallopeptidase [Roseicitreum antarcticum]|uniref:M23 family metallopeptidase n=1 Tax=Roseicitreum antarcticum TaxID=564137 RepID=UPI000B866617